MHYGGRGGGESRTANSDRALVLGGGGLEKLDRGRDRCETFFPDSGSDRDSEETFQISRNLGLELDEFVCLLDSKLWRKHSKYTRIVAKISGESFVKIIKWWNLEIWLICWVMPLLRANPCCISSYTHKRTYLSVHLIVDISRSVTVNKRWEEEKVFGSSGS